MKKTSLTTFHDLARQLHAESPLVHCMTNLVVNQFTANLLLAAGASPAMIVDKDEASEFATLASSLLINVGTLTGMQAEAMQTAIASASTADRPWVLDPVAVGVLRPRTTFVQSLLPLKPSIIRGNASEISALAVGHGGGKGVDSTMSTDKTLHDARMLAARHGVVVAMTGVEDVITDGEQVWMLKHGDPMLTRVTGTGCALSALAAAYLAVTPDAMLAACAALLHLEIAAEQAAEMASGPGTFAPILLDQIALYADNPPGIIHLTIN